MRYYLKVYLAHIKINFSQLSAFRGNFINSVISSSAWGIFSVLSIIVLTSRADSVYGWTRQEIILLTGVYSLLLGVFHTLFTRNFEKFSEIIHYGKFDLMLTKPIDSQFLMTCQKIGFTSLSRVVIGIFVIVYIAGTYSLTVNIQTIVLFTFFMLLGLILLYTVWLLVLTITIKYTKLSNLPEFMFSLTSVGRYPQEILKEGFYSLFLLFFPLTLIVNIPVKLMVNKQIHNDLFITIATTLLLVYLSRIVWQYALRSYTSAGG